MGASNTPSPDPRRSSWLVPEAPEKISLFDRSGLVLLLVTALWYGFFYLFCPWIPKTQTDGWWIWWDQSQYYQCAIDLAHGQLKPATYWFGYSLLGAPFYRVMPVHPFFIPDLLLTLILCASFFAVCRQFVGRLEAWVLVVLGIFLEHYLRDLLLVPWNTLPTYAALYLSAYLLLFNQPGLRHFAVCAVLVWLSLFARPSEIIPLGILYGIAVLALPDGRRRALAALYFAAAVALAGGLSLSLNYHFYGQWGSPYTAAELGKFRLENFALKTYQLFSDGTFMTGSEIFPGVRIKSIGENYPAFLFCCLPGIFYLLKTSGARMLGLPLAMLSSVLFYLTFSPLANLPFFWIYGSNHYIWWIFPWLAFFSYLTFRRAAFALPGPLFLAALLLPLVVFLLIGFRVVPRAVSDDPGSLFKTVTTFSDGTYTVTMTSPVTLDAKDVRLEFQTPPSYEGKGGSVGVYEKYRVTLNGQPRRPIYDFYPSQNGNTFDFSFLVHGVALRPGDVLEIQFKETEPPVLTRASLLDVEFKWGRFSR